MKSDERRAAVARLAEDVASGRPGSRRALADHINALRESASPRSKEDDLRRAARRTLPGRLVSLKEMLRRRRKVAEAAIIEHLIEEGPPGILETAFESVTCEQVAHRLGVSVRSVRAWIRRGVLAAERRGRSWRIDPASVARLERAARGEE
jgi:excisionase family DNA binding protein